MAVGGLVGRPVFCGMHNTRSTHAKSGAERVDNGVEVWGGRHGRAGRGHIRAHALVPPFNEMARHRIGLVCSGTCISGVGMCLVLVFVSHLHIHVMPIDVSYHVSACVSFQFCVRSIGC